MFCRLNFCEYPNHIRIDLNYNQASIKIEFYDNTMTGLSLGSYTYLLFEIVYVKGSF